MISSIPPFCLETQSSKDGTHKGPDHEEVKALRGPCCISQQLMVLHALPGAGGIMFARCMVQTRTQTKPVRPSTTKERQHSLSAIFPKSFDRHSPPLSLGVGECIPHRLKKKNKMSVSDLLPRGHDVMGHFYFYFLAIFVPS